MKYYFYALVLFLFFLCINSKFNSKFHSKFLDTQDERAHCKTLNGINLVIVSIDCQNYYSPKRVAGFNLNVKDLTRYVERIHEYWCHKFNCEISVNEIKNVSNFKIIRVCFLDFFKRTKHSQVAFAFKNDDDLKISFLKNQKHWETLRCMYLNCYAVEMNIFFDAYWFDFKNKSDSVFFLEKTFLPFELQVFAHEIGHAGFKYPHSPSNSRLEKDFSVMMDGFFGWPKSGGMFFEDYHLQSQCMDYKNGSNFKKHCFFLNILLIIFLFFKH